MLGKKFVNLLVVKHFGSDKRGKKLWQCICSCGKKVIVQGANLRSGNSTSCGCIRHHKLIKRNTKHGQSQNNKRSPTYMSWVAMNQRVQRQSYKYPIKIYPGWKDYLVFLHDMGERPAGHSLDRINVMGNYEPTNCRWADIKTQARNKTNTRFLTHKGARKGITDWAEELKIPTSVLRARLDKLHWTTEKTLTTAYIKQARY